MDPAHRPLVILLPPAPVPGLAPDAAAALGLGLLLDALDGLVGGEAEVRVAVGDPLAAPMIAAMLPPGVSCTALPPGDRRSAPDRLAAAERAGGREVRVVEAAAAALGPLGGPNPLRRLAAALDAAGTPSPAPRAWHLAHRLERLAHSA